MSEQIKISDEARECASDLLHLLGKNYSPNATRRGIYEYRIQQLLNQRDAELAELRKSERDLQSKVFELLREREAIQAGVKGGATVPMETYLGKMTNEAGRK